MTQPRYPFCVAVRARRKDTSLSLLYPFAKEAGRRSDGGKDVAPMTGAAAAAAGRGGGGAASGELTWHQRTATAHGGETSAARPFGELGSGGGESSSGGGESSFGLRESSSGGGESTSGHPSMAGRRVLRAAAFGLAATTAGSLHAVSGAGAPPRPERLRPQRAASCGWPPLPASSRASVWADRLWRAAPCVPLPRCNSLVMARRRRRRCRHDAAKRVRDGELSAWQAWLNHLSFGTGGRRDRCGAYRSARVPLWRSLAPRDHDDGRGRETRRRTSSPLAEGGRQ